jgi:hypothetical protein
MEPKLRMRLCEFKLMLIKMTDVYNGGLEVKEIHHDGELSAVKVYNVDSFNSADNRQVTLHDEWLYTVIIRDGIVQHMISESRYIPLSRKLRGVRILPNDFYTSGIPASKQNDDY